VEMEAIWHAHKRFIVQVGTGALVFVALLGWRASIAGEAVTLQKRNASAQAALQDDIARLENVEGLEKGRAAALGDKLEPSVLRTVLWTPEPSFQLPANETSPGLFYSTAASRTAKDIVEHAARWNATVPSTSGDLGLPAEVDAARVQDALAEADVVRRVVTRVLDGGVRTVKTVAPGDPTYTQRDGATGFVRAVPLRLVFEATTATLAGALAELQVEGSAVEVVDLTVQRVTRAGGAEVLEVELAVQALTVVEQAPAGRAATEAHPQPGRRGPRRFGRDR
jgi:hypothetical protein